MANPNWQKGGLSPNPEGRRKMKSSARTVRGMVERFIKRNITPQKLQAMYDGLKTERDRFTMLTELMPYCAAKLSAVNMDLRFEKLDDDSLQKLHSSIIANVLTNIQLPDQLTLTNGQQS